MDEDAALAELDRVLADSVLMHQRADVPYGMFLSGGIDSSAVLAMMARLNERPVQAFTIGFSRSAALRTSARRRARSRSALGAEHVEVEFREADFWRLLPEIARAMDDPAADYAILPTYKLAATAREAGLKVILSGEGGDELFAGYGRYRSVMRPWWAGGRLLRGARQSRPARHAARRSRRLARRHRRRRAACGAAGRTRLQVAQATDCADWLPNDLLTKLDRCLMAHGVEGRTPFLDPVVADFAFRLPDELKVRQGLGKWLLRRWLARACAAAAEPFAQQARLHRAGRRMDRAARRAARAAGRGAARRARDLPARRGRETVPRRRGAGTGFAAWTLLFYALWHRRHIEAPAARARRLRHARHAGLSWGSICQASSSPARKGRTGPAAVSISPARATSFGARRYALVVDGQAVEARAVERGEGLEPVERVFFLEHLRIDFERGGRREDAGAAAIALLVVHRVRRGVGAEEEFRIARNRGAAQRLAVRLALGDRQAIHMRPEAAGEERVAVDDEMMRGDGRGDVGAGRWHEIAPRPASSHAPARS